jgi:hypothetical protein
MAAIVERSRSERVEESEEGSGDGEVVSRLLLNSLCLGWE